MKRILAGCFAIVARLLCLMSLVAAKSVPSAPTSRSRRSTSARTRGNSYSDEESLFSQKDYDDVLASWSDDFPQWDDNDSQDLPLYYDDSGEDEESYEAYDPAVDTREESSGDLSYRDSKAGKNQDAWQNQWGDYPSTSKDLAGFENPRSTKRRRRMTNASQADQHEAAKDNQHVGRSMHSSKKEGDNNAASVFHEAFPRRPNSSSTITTKASVVRASPAKVATSGPEVANQSSFTLGISPWVRQYLSTRPGLLIIPHDYWLDNFNLAQLPPLLETWAQVSPLAHGVQFPSGWLYKQALQRILSQDNNATALSTVEVVGVVDDIVERAACVLYQLVHQRYALAPRGLEAVRRRFSLWKYQENQMNSTQPPPYGRCPRVACRGFALVPSGPDHPSCDHRNDDSRSWRYCGLCQQTWRSMDDVLDSTEGCAWGSTFGPLFHLTFPYFLYETQTGGATVAAPEPRVFGFRLHPGAVGQITRAK